MSGAINGGVAFTQQADALRQRLGTLLPSDRWTDTLGEVNNWGFAVAGAKKDSLLQSIGQALLETMQDGRDVRHFQRQFAAIVTREGWTYRGPIGWRARVIFETNLGQSREAGKWRQITEARAAGRDLWVRYVATMDLATRPEHAAWNGTILPPEHPWWRTHSPKNGWGCRCTVLMVSPGMLRREGWKVSDQAPPVEIEDRTINTAAGPQRVRVPKGIDTGFGHSPGQRPMDALVPRPAGEHPLVTLGDMTAGDANAVPRIFGTPSPVPPPPAPRVVPPQKILPGDLPAEEYVKRFLAEFGAAPGKPALFRDVLGADVLISEEMFRDRRTGDLKVTKRGRAPTILLAAQALLDPDEVWTSLDVTGDGKGGQRVRLLRYYLAWFTTPDRRRTGFALFEQGIGTWRGVTSFEPSAGEDERKGLAYLERQRRGVLLFRRGE
ncbi:PBECR2 nuclease fold domain-containing protein [Falsiroseomonas sp.]|uniref:PBECR2 nuclease fold domain-containing protein n=1 Tax=Falsiroseomonas sp. TaxID=2870721 RepID=UPI003F72B723